MITAKLGSAVLGVMVLGNSSPTNVPAISFVVDRTQEHVDLLRRFQMKGWSNLSLHEQEQWYGEAAKGAYNYTDLNRVENVVSVLATELGLSLNTKTNWTAWDVPTQADMNRYLNNVVALRDACPWEMVFPPIPNSMNDLTYETANNIETILLMIYTKNQTVRSGEIYCCEV